MRPRKFALPQAGTGGYGIRPYVFCGGRSTSRHEERDGWWGVMTLGGRCTNADGNVPFMSTRAFWFLGASAISTQPPKKATTVILM